MRKTFFVFPFLLLLLAGWYFLLKPYDYSISFKTPAAPGSVYLQALDWHSEQGKLKEKEPFKSVTRNTKIAATRVKLKWELEPVRDSLTSVRVRIKTLEGNFKERLSLLFGETALQREVQMEVEAFRDFLEMERKLYEVQVQGKTVVPGTTCACVSVETSPQGKAAGMMRTINFLHQYLLNNNLELEGTPRVEVTEWNLKTNRISFDFCFPLASEGNLPPSAGKVFIKEIPSKEALMANFQGHYRFSHNAWFELLKAAELKGIEVEAKPLEVFLDNPELGGDDRQWKAEIYLPLR